MAYKCEIVADSIMPQGHRLTTYLITYPRIIHAEMCRHRMLSRNTASSRAIPFKKMVKDVENNPFIPIAWQKDHKGMQGTEYLDIYKSQIAKEHWLKARDSAVLEATIMNRYQVTKQLCNRLLEPFMWTTELVSGTEWDNFFELRCPKYCVGNEVYRSKKDAIGQEEDEINKRILSGFSKLDWLSINESQAEIHIQKIAEMMWDAMNESIPNQLEAGEWHMPFTGNFNTEKLLELSGVEPEDFELICRKISTARAARLSYMTFDGKIDYEKDIQLHDRLLESRHMSPFEHCSKAMTHDEYYSFRKGFIDMDSIEVIDEDSPTNGWCRNYKGFIQYRHLIETGVKL